MLLLRCDNYALNAILHKYILSLALNWSTLGFFLTWSGRLFHCFGPATKKLLLAKVFLLVLGTISLIYMLLDLSPCL